MHLPTFVLLSSLPATVAASSPSFEPPVAAVDIGVDVNVNLEPPPALVAPAEQPVAPRLTGGRWEGGILFEIGRFGINHVGGIHYGLRAHVGRQLGPLRIALEGTFAKFSGTERQSWDDFEGMTFGGELHRIGIGLRYRAAAETAAIGAAGYVEVGAGRQRILWNGGGETLDRSDVMIGLGYEIVGGRHGFGGMDMGVRFLASPTVDRSAPGCIQICATTSSADDRTRDLGVMFVLGAAFGS